MRPLAMRTVLTHGHRAAETWSTNTGWPSSTCAASWVPVSVVTSAWLAKPHPRPIALLALIEAMDGPGNTRSGKGKRGQCEHHGDTGGGAHHGPVGGEPERAAGLVNAGRKLTGMIVV